MTKSKNNKTTPGIHPNFFMGAYDPVEQRILRKLSTEFFLTGGGNINLLNSKYNYFLMKPTSVFTEMFNIEREIPHCYGFWGGCL